MPIMVHIDSMIQNACGESSFDISRLPVTFHPAKISPSHGGLVCISAIGLKKAWCEAVVEII